MMPIVLLALNPTTLGNRKTIIYGTQLPSTLNTSGFSDPAALMTSIRQYSEPAFHLP
jgi:hypothetical protein